jgi:ATP-dependent RNA helicase DHX36
MFPPASEFVIESLLVCDETIINYDLIEELVDHIHEHAETYAPVSSAPSTKLSKDGKNNNGAILIFLPGLMEITTLYDRLRLKDEKQFKVYPLHSSLSTSEQKAVFQRPLSGVRKVVIATNIAETSITIDDVVFVIDAGRVKENRYDHERRMAMLVETWVSRASAKQRRGRAGRVQPGVCFHLFSSRTERHVFSDYTMPEMLRVPLHEMCLQIKLLDLMEGDARGFLKRAVNPPNESALDTAIQTLRELRAIDAEKDDRLTALGYHLATLPVDPRLGKILLFGALFRVCEPMLTVAAAMSFRSPFLSPLDKRDEADRAKRKFNIGQR